MQLILHLFVQYSKFAPKNDLQVFSNPLDTFPQFPFSNPLDTFPQFPLALLPIPNVFNSVAEPPLFWVAPAPEPQLSFISGLLVA